MRLTLHRLTSIHEMQFVIFVADCRSQINKQQLPIAICWCWRMKVEMLLLEIELNFYAKKLKVLIGIKSDTILCTFSAFISQNDFLKREIIFCAFIAFKITLTKKELKKQSKEKMQENN